MSDAFETIIYTVVDGIATVTLNRPAQKNALNLTMRGELCDVVMKIRRDRDIRAVILCGGGGDFCAGGDIRGMNISSAEAGRNRLDDLHAWLEPLMDLDRAVVAAVNGVAYGAGFSLALAADFVLATPRTRFCMPFMKVGLIPDCGALYTLPRIVGMQRAKEILFSAREISANEAQQLGLVLEIVPENVLLQRAQAIAQCMVNASASAFGLAKRVLNKSFESSLSTVLAHESTAQGIVFTTDFHREAAQRFVDKKTPLFQWPAKAYSS